MSCLTDRNLWAVAGAGRLLDIDKPVHGSPGDDSADDIAYGRAAGTTDYPLPAMQAATYLNSYHRRAALRRCSTTEPA
jgi:hypothetical protein